MTYLPIPPSDNPPQFRSIPDTLPSNIEIEEAVLGGCLLDPHAIARIADVITPEAFYIPAHKDIFKAILALHKQEKSTDLLTVINYLADKNLLAGVGGQNKLAALVDRAVSAVNIDVHGDALVEKYLRRKLINVANNIQFDAYDQDKPLSWVLEQIEQKVLQLTQLRKHDGKSYWNKWDAVTFDRLCKDLDEIEAIENTAQQDWAMRKLAKKWKFGSKKELLDFHAKWLDSQSTTKTYTAMEYFEKHGNSEQPWLIPGFVPAQSIIAVYADGGVGKTRLAFTLAKHAVTGQAFGYENMSFDPMNVLLIETDQGARVTSKLLEMQDFLADETVGNRLVICDDWTIGEFGRLKTMLKQHKPKLVIIDSLTSISVDSIYSEKDAEYARPLVRLRHIAHEYNCTFLVIHHSNANGDMRGSRAVRNTVDEVLKFSKNQNELGEFNVLTIEKTRSRAPGAYKFTYDEDTWGWRFKGRVEDDAMGGNAVSTNNMTRCLDFLRQNMGIPFEAIEVAETLGINRETVRRDLKRAVAEGLCNSGRSTRDGRALVYYYGTRETKNTSPTSGITYRRCDDFSNAIEKDTSRRCDQPDQPDQSILENFSEKNVETTDQVDHISNKKGSNQDEANNTDVINENRRLTDQVDHFATLLNNRPPDVTVLNNEESTPEESQEKEESKNEHNSSDFEIGQTVIVTRGIYQGNKLEVLALGDESLKLKFGGGSVFVFIEDVVSLPPDLPEPELFTLGTGNRRKRKVEYSSLVGKRVKIKALGEMADIVGLSTSPEKPLIWQSVEVYGRKGFAALDDLE